MEKAIKRYWPVFVLPTLIAFIIGFVWPFIWGAGLSFCKFTTVKNVQLVGLNNYKMIWIDDTFTHAFWFTAAFTIVSTVLINVLAFSIALLLTRGMRGTNAFRTIFFLPNLIGGSADLAPSNKTNMSGEGDFSKATPEGRNLHFGVRELAMTAIGNGLMLHGGLRAYVATFFVFSDYVKPMARLSALMQVPLTFVLTHDSIGVGEDGPTHEPIEQLAMLRAMPNFHVFRPCDATETEAAWYSAVTSQRTPTALVLTRQNLTPMAGSSRDALKGAYVIDDCEGTPEVILMASGSEVELAVKAKAELEKEGQKVRVVSMPCMDLFEEQSEEYKESVLPKAVRKRVAIEALSDFGWGRYVGLDGAYVTMKGFGASGPAAVLFEHFGFTVDHVVETVKSL